MSYMIIFLISAFCALDICVIFSKGCLDKNVSNFVKNFVKLLICLSVAAGIFGITLFFVEVVRGTKAIDIFTNFYNLKIHILMIITIVLEVVWCIKDKLVTKKS